MSGYLTFVMGGRELAASLDQVREVVRAAGLEPLAGVRAPVTGLLELRGEPLPVVDLRNDDADPLRGDVVVVTGGADGPLGLAVDAVVAVVGPDALSGPDDRPLGGLPGYVRGVLHDAERPVLLVDLLALAGLGDPARLQLP